MSSWFVENEVIFWFLFLLPLSHVPTIYSGRFTLLFLLLNVKREAVNTNFLSYQFDPTENRNRV